jgi:hypothetical protein
MRIHLYKFIDRLRGAEARGAKDFSMSITDAKDLHADITRLLLDLQTLQDTLAQKPAQEPSITVEMKGGTFK